MRALPLLLLAGLLALPGAQAHMGEEDPPHGTLVVPAGGSARLDLEAFHPRDRLEWVWTAEPAAGAAQLGQRLLLRDASGAEAEAAGVAAGATFGRYEASEAVHGGALVWTNAGAEDVAVTYTYQTSAEFWSRPDLVLPAVIPFVALGLALAAGRLADRWFKARRARAAQASEAAATSTFLFVSKGER